MKPIRLVAVAAILAGGCYSQDSTYAQSTMPEPQQVMGPPGGDMDPGWGYGSPGDQPAYDPGMQADASAAVDGYAGDQPTDPNAMAPVTDAEIDQTLQPYGQWVEDEDYGRVWRPDATVVGVDFTPYETCGTWVWTDYGWTYSCDWGWGWLPFHYGRWAWCDGYWGWQPGYEWGPAWVDWRSGGGYVGWRPSAPLVRDHRGEHQGPTFHDHRTQHEANWRFASASDFGKPHIRSHTFGDIAEGLRVTAPVTRPTVRPMTQPIRAASIMRARVMGARANGIGVGAAAPARPGSTFGNARPTYGGYRTPYEGYRSPYQGYRQPAPYRAPQPSYQPYRAPLQAYQPPYRGPSTYQPPVRGPSNTYRPPAPTYTRPPAYGGGGSYGGSRPSPSFGGGSSFGGSRPSPSFGGGGSFGGSHSSGGSFGGGGHSSGGSFGGGGHSSGGGGGHFGGGGGGHHR